ncbi:hypothetical protein TCDM_08175 [Trypanosoma cruzi Dm28c]|uniref:Uncharacterized protein n=1 Tax=Trypanosoma cruzi Dm28c TaxID=1416333 RepID=V5BHE0_TRYCR|nr:hypothetical protein TCDM_08175 [Trypanosoma cruzi Dm28c]
MRKEGKVVRYPVSLPGHVAASLPHVPPAQLSMKSGFSGSVDQQGLPREAHHGTLKRSRTATTQALPWIFKSDNAATVAPRPTIPAKLKCGAGHKCTHATGQQWLLLVRMAHLCSATPIPGHFTGVNKEKEEASATSPVSFQNVSNVEKVDGQQGLSGVG